MQRLSLSNQERTPNTQGRTLVVRGVDMLDGTPVLDLKPYLSSIPAEKLRRLAGWRKPRRGGRPDDGKGGPSDLRLSLY